MAWSPKPVDHKISHAQIRCRERYGFTLSCAGLAHLQNLIGGRSSMFVRHADFCEIWDVCHDGKMLRVVYQPEARKIMTFLPPDRTSRPTKRTNLSFRERLMTAKIVLSQVFGF